MATDDDKVQRLVGVGQLLLGASLIVKGFLNVRTQQAQLGPGQVAGAPRALAGATGEDWKGKIIGSVKFYKVGNIDERVKYIRQLVNKGSLHPMVREKAVEILTKKCGEKWCVREKDYMGEISALFWSLRDPRSGSAMRYVRDHQKVDQFHGADKLQKLNAGDCDDGSVLLSSWLMAVGYPVKFRVVQAREASTWSHIYVLAGTPPTNPTRWIPLDWSVTTATPGWEVEGAASCALTGRPAGLISKVKDFDV